jgi:hypothetical protein
MVMYLNTMAPTTKEKTYLAINHAFTWAAENGITQLLVSPFGTFVSLDIPSFLLFFDGNLFFHPIRLILQIMAGGPFASVDRSWRISKVTRMVQ